MRMVKARISRDREQQIVEVLAAVPARQHHHVVGFERLHHTVDGIDANGGSGLGRYRG